MRGEGIVPVMDVNSGNGNGFGNFGGNDWSWIIVLFLIFGWGRNGFGGSGVGENYILSTDFANIERKLDGVNQGLCDGFYTTAQQIYGIQNTLCQGFNGLNIAVLQGNNMLSSQLANCCCGIERNLLENRYLDERNTCSIVNAINMNTRDLLENANANYRAIHEELVTNKLEMKNDRIAEQQNEINALRLRASQEAQNNYLVAKLGPKCAEPAYIVPNPNCCYNYQVSQCSPCGNSQFI